MCSYLDTKINLFVAIAAAVTTSIAVAAIIVVASTMVATATTFMFWRIDFLDSGVAD
jgi:hypothetical protein